MAPTPETPTPAAWRLLGRFWPYARGQRLLVAGATTGLFAQVLFRLVEPWPLKFVFDRVVVVPSPDDAPAPGWIGSLPPYTLLTACAVAVVVIASARAASTYASRVGFAIVGNRVLTEARRDLFSHLQRLSLAFHARRRTGDLITRVTADIGRLKEIVVTAALPLFANVCTLVGMLAVMVWMEWRLALIAMAILPLFYLSTRRIGGRIRTVARKQRRREGEIGATAAEAMSSIRTVQALGLEGVQERTFSAQNRSSMREGVQAKRLSVRLVTTVDVLIALATAVVLFLGARMVVDGRLTPGDLIVFLAYLKNAFKPMRDLAKYSGRLAIAAASAERIMEVLDTVPQVTDRPGARPAPRPLAEIAFEGVGFEYEPGHPALRDLDLRARTGDVVALVGASGAGKSTAMSLLLRLYDPTAGRILFDGHDLRDLTLASARGSIAVVPQDNVLFAMSVRDNIACGVSEATPEAIERAARTAQAHDFIMELPEGYDTIVGERGETLSEGQRHRIAIARAALRDTSVLVLDEPASSLDNETNRRVRDALRELRQRRITFVIAHDLSLVADATTIVVLERGVVVERGHHEELLAAGGTYARMHAMRGAGAKSTAVAGASAPSS